MCIAVYAEGHIVIDFMLESIFPLRAASGAIDAFNQSFDLVIKNQSGKPLGNLVVVHPRRLYPAGNPGSDQDPWSASVPCWTPRTWFGESLHKKDMLKIDPHESSIEFALRADLRSLATAERFATHKAYLLDPIAVLPHPTIAKDRNVIRLLESHTEIPTVLLVAFDQPMAPHREGAWETVYYIRLNFSGLPVMPITAEHMSLNWHGAPPEIFKQVFAVMAPSLVARRLEGRVGHIAQNGNDHTKQSAANALHKSLVEDGLFHPDKTTRVRDHRLAVVVPKDMLFDSREFGKLLPWETKLLAPDAGIATGVERARVWLAGAAAFPESDPVLIAHRVCRHMIDDASLSKSVGYFSEVGLAMASECPLIHNIRLVLDALSRLGTIQRHERESAWALARPSELHNDANWLEALRNRLASLEWELNLRTAIATLALDGRRFDEQPFVLHCAFTGVSRQR